MVSLGKTYELEVVKSVGFGFYLDAKELGEVLLPRKFAPKNLSVGDLIEVFLYLDSDDLPIATTQKPKVHVGEFAYLSVVDTTDIGAFLDWGLDKDLLVPFAEQHRPMEADRSYLVYLYIDKNDGRIVASSKVDKFLDDPEKSWDAFSDYAAGDIPLTKDNFITWGETLPVEDVPDDFKKNLFAKDRVKKLEPVSEGEKNPYKVASDESVIEELQNIKDLLEIRTDDVGHITNVGLKQGISFKDFQSHYPDITEDNLIKLFDTTESRNIMATNLY